jgi:XisH protein
MAYDDCHPQVVRALEKAGWRVDPVSFRISSGGISVYPDVRAWQSNGASHQVIIIEIKCFSDASKEQDELYRAIGQYVIYRNVLKLRQYSAQLYLATPMTTFNRLFKQVAVTATIQDVQISLIVVDIEREEVVQWLD